MRGGGRFGGRDLKLPEGMRGEMREVVGEIATGERLLAIARSADILVCVGDYCTAEILKGGVVPKLSVVDSITKRGRFGEIRFPGDVSIFSARNPPETITAELWAAIAEALQGDGKAAIIVDGEEDLAALVCIYLAPEGTTVIYGVPNRGAMAIQVEDRIRERVERVLEKMEG